jgi:hypothetical protein
MLRLITVDHVHDVLAAVVGDAEEEPLAAAGTDAGFFVRMLV